MRARRHYTRALMNGLSLYERFLFARRRKSNTLLKLAVNEVGSSEFVRAQREYQMWRRVEEALKLQWKNYSHDNA